MYMIIWIMYFSTLFSCVLSIFKTSSALMIYGITDNTYQIYAVCLFWIWIKERKYLSYAIMIIFCCSPHYFNFYSYLFLLHKLLFVCFLFEKRWVLYGSCAHTHFVFFKGKRRLIISFCFNFGTVCYKYQYFWFYF
jgi:hypothetical protein